LKKGLYGLKEASRLWYEELSDDLEKHGDVKITGDPGCFLFHIFISGEDAYVGDLVDKIKIRFRVSKDEIEHFTYTGMSIRSDKSGRIFLNQNQYSEELVDVPKDAEQVGDDKKKTILRGVVG